MAPDPNQTLLNVAQLAIESSRKTVDTLGTLIQVVTVCFSVIGLALMAHIFRIAARVERDVTKTRDTLEGSLKTAQTEIAELKGELEAASKQARGELGALTLNLQATIELALVKSYLEHKDWAAAEELSLAVTRDKSLDLRLQARAHGQRAYALKRLSRVREAIHHICESIETLKLAAEAHPIVSKGMLARCHYNAACYYTLTAEYDRAKSHLQDSMNLLDEPSRAAQAIDIWKDDVDLDQLRVRCGGPGGDLEKIAPRPSA